MNKLFIPMLLLVATLGCNGPSPASTDALGDSVIIGGGDTVIMLAGDSVIVGGGDQVVLSGMDSVVVIGGDSLSNTTYCELSLQPVGATGGQSLWIICKQGSAP